MHNPHFTEWGCDNASSISIMFLVVVMCLCSSYRPFLYLWVYPFFFLMQIIPTRTYGSLVRGWMPFNSLIPLNVPLVSIMFDHHYSKKSWASLIVLSCSPWKTRFLFFFILIDLGFWNSNFVPSYSFGFFRQNLPQISLRSCARFRFVYSFDSKPSLWFWMIFFKLSFKLCEIRNWLGKLVKFGPKWLGKWTQDFMFLGSFCWSLEWNQVLCDSEFKALNSGCSFENGQNYSIAI